MATVHTWQFDVRRYELDSFGHVNNAVYQNYLEETATQASTAVGYPYEWYVENNRAWVIRRMSVRYLTPLVYGDRVEVESWVSTFSRVYSHREYRLKRVSDGQPVLKARAKWVYIDMESGRPLRIPDGFEEAFAPTGETEDLGVRLRNPQVFEDAPAFTSTRRVQHYELDTAQHVNNAVYLNWLEQAMFNAFAGAGWPVERMHSIGFMMYQASHDIEYLLPARYGDRLEITSRPIELTRVRGAWDHAVRNADTGELLARDYSVGAFLDVRTGRPRSLPDEILEGLMRGPVSMSSEVG